VGIAQKVFEVIWSEVKVTQRQP